MNGDTLEVMKVIGTNHSEVMSAINNLNSEFSEFKGKTENRIQNIEENQDKTDKRQWYHSVIVFIGSAIHHDLGTWLHWRF